MPALEPLQYSDFSLACDPVKMGIGIRKLESSPMKIYIPDAVTIIKIRNILESGRALDYAYAQSNFKAYLPTLDIRPCISEVFKTPQSTTLDAGQISGATCTGFNNCMQEWIMANQPNPDANPNKRRMAIGKWEERLILTPSPQESDCIISKFTLSRDMRSAYSECGCSDILPAWPGGVEMITALHRSTPTICMYRICKDALNIMAIQYYVPETGLPSANLTTVPISPATPAITPAIITLPAEEKKSVNPYVLLALAGLVFLMIKK